MLSGERAEQQLQTGDRAGAAALLVAMDPSASGVGLVPEQAWENPDLPASPYGTDPATASIGFVDGEPAGSASPLTWAQAQQSRLILGVGAGRPVEQPEIVADRYVRHGPPAPAPLTSPRRPTARPSTGHHGHGHRHHRAGRDGGRAVDRDRHRRRDRRVDRTAAATGAFSADVPVAVRHLRDHRRGDDRGGGDRVRPADR